MSSPAAVVRGGWSAGARAAGTVVALGYLLGLVRGPIVAAVGGLALVTLGRCALASPPDDLVLGASLAVLAGALGVGVLRWEALDLGDLRGAQAVLGPTVLVGPVAAAAACWAAALASVTALACWLRTTRAPDGAGTRLVEALWMAEGAVAALAVASVFWGPSIPRGSLLGGEGVVALVEWLVAAGAVTGAAAGGAVLLARGSRAWRWIALAASGGAVLVAAIVLVGAIS